MKKKLGKVQHLGTYKEFLEKMVERGSTMDLEKQKKTLSKDQLNLFGKYNGYIGKDFDSLVNTLAVPDDFYKDTTRILIKSNRYSREEINKAIYVAQKYLNRKWVNEEKEFAIQIEEQ